MLEVDVDVDGNKKIQNTFNDLFLLLSVQLDHNTKSQSACTSTCTSTVTTYSRQYI